MRLCRITCLLGYYCAFLSSGFAASAPTPTPIFNLAAGTYKTAQTVTIRGTTAGAAIYYTTNGAAPTTASTPYKGPISVASSLSLRAVPVLAGSPDSQVATAIYTIAPSATPTFSLPAGTYGTTQTVTISDTTAGATIYYTTNGLAPTTASTPYGGPITVAGSLSLRAIAVLPGGPASPVATAIYTIAPAAIPTFSLPAGTYGTTQTVTISDTTAGASIYYTTSGLAPTTASTPYGGPITVASSLSLRAIAVFPGGPASPVATAIYTIAPAATPTFSLPAGKYVGSQRIRISDATAGATIYYTTSGLAPTTGSTPYTQPIVVGSTLPLRAIAVFPGGPVSQVATATYTISQASTPIQTPNAASSFFGMNIDHLLSGTPWPNLSFATIRLWDTGTLWGDLNPTRDTYNWQNLDKQINLARANDTKLIFTFGGVPPWALPANVPIQSVTRSGGVVTVTTTGHHGMYYNSTQSPTSQSMVSVAGVPDQSFNGSFYLTGTASVDTLTYAQVGGNSASSSGTISAICGGVYAPAACAEAPANLADWDQYLNELLLHVAPGTIQGWELWNEPNLTDFWRGDPMTLVTMSKHAQGIIKSVDPDAIVLSPSVTENFETQVECTANVQLCGSTWISNWLALGGKNYIDVVAFHGYPVVGMAPEQIQGAVDLLASAMAQNGVGPLSLWDTESSWGRNVALPSQGDQVSWLGRHLLLEQSIGVQRSFWYAYDNASWGSLWDAKSGVHPAGNAYEQVETWLVGATLSQPCAATPTDSTTYVCGFTRPNGYVAQAIWNTVGGKSFVVSPQFIQYRDLFGAVQPMTGETVQISTSPILLETANVF